MSALMLAAATGAEVVLPPAFVRRSFGEKEPGHHTWTPLPLENLLDVEQIISSWQRRGVIVHRVRGAATSNTKFQHPNAHAVQGCTCAP